MAEKETYQAFFDAAVKMYAVGRDNTYIELQLAEAGCNDEDIDRIIKYIKKLKKSVKRRAGIKKLIGGVATCAVAILFTSLSFHKGSPVAYILYGMGALGVMTTMKGVAEIIGLL